MNEIIESIPVTNIASNELKFLYLLLIVVIYLIIDFIAIRFINRFYKLLYKSTTTLTSAPNDDYLVSIKLFSRLTIFIVRVAMITIACMIALSIFGIKVASFLASAGFVGILITIALGDIIRDLIAGFVLLKDKYISVGDLVNIENFDGKVLAINARTIILENDSGDQLIVYNRLIAKILKKG